MNKEKRNRELLNILEKKKRSLAKKLNIEEESGCEAILDAILKSEDFTRWMPGKEKSSVVTSKETDTISEMLSDMASLAHMVEHLEQILMMASTGKMCPLRGMREAGEMVDRADSILESWFQYFGLDA